MREECPRRRKDETEDAREKREIAHRQDQRGGPKRGEGKGGIRPPNPML